MPTGTSKRKPPPRPIAKPGHYEIEDARRRGTKSLARCGIGTRPSAPAKRVPAVTTKRAPAVPTKRSAVAPSAASAGAYVVPLKRGERTFGISAGEALAADGRWKVLDEADAEDLEHRTRLAARGKDIFLSSLLSAEVSEVWDC